MFKKNKLTVHKIGDTSPTGVMNYLKALELLKDAFKSEVEFVLYDERLFKEIDDSNNQKNSWYYGRINTKKILFDILLP